VCVWRILCSFWLKNSIIADNHTLDMDGFLQNDKRDIQQDTDGFLQNDKRDIQQDTDGFLQNDKRDIQQDTDG
jgi:hypothetical protein